MFDMVSRRGFVSLSAAAAAGLGLAGCSGNKTSEPAGSVAGSAKASSKKAVELQVFAANSLEKALPEVQELYTDQTGTTFADTQFKASGDLVEQMKAGATVDVLITASKGTMDDAETAELVDADTREDMFVNDLVIIRAEGSDTKVEAIADVANLDGKIAIGDAKTVPAGKYANQALASVGLYTGIEGDDGEFTEEDFCYPKGIEDYVLEKVGTDYLTEPFFIEADRRGRDREDLPDYNVKITACMCFSRTFMMQEYYHNSSWLENGGSPEKAARSALTSAIDAYIKQQGKYNKNESGIKWQDVQDCLVLVTNCFSTQTSYENQTKKAINNRFIQQAMTAFFKERLSTYLIENKDAANKIMEQVLINKRSRENAEKTRQSIKTNLQQKTDMANRVQKFIDCRSKDKSRREIYIVEGDSAAGAIRTSRDAEFQGVMPVRGKILNCLKEDYPRIFKSDIIMDLMRVLGCGVEIKDKRIKNLGAFDLDNLNWNKVIICTDADVDGYHIRTLVLTMLYRLVPTLIDEGYVYIAESPLYEINCKEKTYFAYTELEKNGILKEIGDQKCSINRSKGLGENDPDMMWLTTMNPETRRLIKVEPEDVTKMETMFNLLLGNDEAGRKRHISEHGKEYLDQLDLQ